MMKKDILVIIVITVIVLPVSAQTWDIEDIKSSELQEKIYGSRWANRVVPSMETILWNGLGDYKIMPFMNVTASSGCSSAISSVQVITAGMLATCRVQSGYRDRSSMALSCPVASWICWKTLLW